MTLGIEVKNLSFSYDGKTPVLKNINFTVIKARLWQLWVLADVERARYVNVYVESFLIFKVVLCREMYLYRGSYRAFSLPKLATK